MGITGEEPVLSRLDRLDNMVRQLEEMRGNRKYNNSHYNRSPSPRSSSASTPSSGTLTSICTDSVDLSPTSKTLEKYCRPMNHVMVETRFKGTLIQQLEQAEDRLLKLEEDLEEKKRRQAANVEKKGQKKGVMQFVKQCVIVKHSQHKRADWKLGKEGSKIK